MRQWYFNVSDFKPEVGFEFHFEAGPGENPFLHLCKITEVIDGKKLSYTWRFSGFEGDSLLTFELFPVSEKTTLKLTHSGLDTFPPKPEFARQNFVEGWNHILGISLKNFVEGQGQ